MPDALDALLASVPKGGPPPVGDALDELLRDAPPVESAENAANRLLARDGITGVTVPAPPNAILAPPATAPSPPRTIAGAPPPTVTPVQYGSPQILAEEPPSPVAQRFGVQRLPIISTTRQPAQIAEEAPPYRDVWADAMKRAGKGDFKPVLSAAFTSPVDMRELDRELGTFLVGPFAIHRGAIEAGVQMATAPGTYVAGAALSRAATLPQAIRTAIATGKTTATAAKALGATAVEAADAAVSAYFAGNMASGLYEAGKQGVEAAQDGDWDTAAKSLGFGSVDALFAFLSARNAYSKGKSVVQGINEAANIGRIREAMQSELNRRERGRKAGERAAREANTPRLAGPEEAAPPAEVAPPPQLPPAHPAPAGAAVAPTPEPDAIAKGATFDLRSGKYTVTAATKNRVTFTREDATGKKVAGTMPLEAFRDMVATPAAVPAPAVAPQPAAEVQPPARQPDALDQVLAEVPKAEAPAPAVQPAPVVEEPPAPQEAGPTLEEAPQVAPAEVAPRVEAPKLAVMGPRSVEQVYKTKLSEIERLTAERDKAKSAFESVWKANKDKLDSGNYPAVEEAVDQFESKLNDSQKALEAAEGDLELWAEDNLGTNIGTGGKAGLVFEEPLGKPAKVLDFRPPEKAKPTAAPKQPWEMTREEFGKVATQTISGPDSYIVEPSGDRWLVPGTRSKKAGLDQTHRAIVSSAVEHGKPVPPEVLADYPDLKPKEEPNAQPIGIETAPSGTPAPGVTEVPGQVLPAEGSATPAVPVDALDDVIAETLAAAPTMLLTGDTYRHRQQIKRLGGKWDAERKGWAVPDTPKNRTEAGRLSNKIMVSAPAVETKERVRSHTAESALAAAGLTPAKGPITAPVEGAEATTRKNASDKAAEIWAAMDENQRAGVPFGLFPAEVMSAAEAEGYKTHELSVALMDQAKLAKQPKSAPEPLFREGERVTWTDSKGETLTGKIRSDVYPGDDHAGVDTDQIKYIGGRIPIGRSEYVPIRKLQRIEAEPESALLTPGKEESTVKAGERDVEPGRATEDLAPARAENTAALEGTPPEDVSGVEGTGQVGGRGDHGAKPDRGRNGPAGEPRQAGRAGGVGTGSGAVGVSAERGGSARAKATSSHDYRITDADLTNLGSPKQRFNANLEAIETLKKIEAENRPATEEEKQKLVRYVGWGGLAQPAFSWNYEYKELQDRLKSLLTEEEFEEARRSTQNAHYTSAPVVRGMWRAVQRLGVPARSRILEPAAGIGHFLGLQPAEMLPANRMATEMDSLTSRIAKALYPDTNVLHSPYQEAPFPNNYFDLAISNVPFGKVEVHDPAFRRYPYIRHGIHNYFFAKALEQVKPGGIVAFVTSRYTMDSGSNQIRNYLAERADLLGAIRLPGGKEGAFAENAGTEVTTDIIFLQKRPVGAEPAGEAWTKTVERKGKDAYGEEIPYRLNEYFDRHPEMMLGEMTLGGSMYRRAEPMLKGEFTEAAFNAALNRLPENVFTAGEPEAKAFSAPIIMEEGDKSIKRGAFGIKDGKLVVREGDALTLINPPAPVKERIVGMIRVRDALREVYRTQLEDLPDAQINAARKKLNQIYDVFVKVHGPISGKMNRSVYQTDPDYPFIRALEDYDQESGKATKREVFEQRTIRAYKPVEKVDSASEALTVTLAETGRLDWRRMESLTGRPPADLVKELGDLVYQDPSGEKWVTADEYLSGQVRDKLKQAQFAAKTDPSYQRNVEALEKVQPQDLTEHEISVRAGVGWIEPRDIKSFIGEEILGDEYLAREDIEVTYSDASATWSVFAGDASKGSQKNKAYGDDFLGSELLELSLNLKRPKVWDHDPDGNTHLNVQATVAAEAQQDRIMEAFQKWIWKDEARKTRLLKRYNEQYNGLRLREFDGSHLQFPGMAKGILRAGDLDPHQKSAAWRIIQTGNTLLAHVVGAGKTYTMIAAGMEMKRVGLIRKPIFVVPNHLVEQWADDVVRLYPNANVLVAGKETFKKGKRQETAARIASGNYDAIIISHKSFEFLPVSDKTFEDFVNQELAEINAELDRLRSMEGKKNRGKGKRKGPTVKNLENRRENLLAKIQNRAKREAKDVTIDFENLGVDQMFVDEAHMFKNLAYTSGMERISGLPNSNSNRAFDMFIKARYLSQKNAERGVVFATGTPVSNSMAEMYTMMRYLALPYMRQQGIDQFDAWARMFGRAARSIEVAPEGKRFRVNSRFVEFVNVPELIQGFRLFSDVKTAKDLNLPRPEVEGGRSKTIPVAGNPLLNAFVWSLGKRADRIRGRMVDPDVDNMLKVTFEGRMAALDIRLFADRAREAARGLEAEVAGLEAILAELKTRKYTDPKEERQTRANIRKAEKDLESARKMWVEVKPYIDNPRLIQSEKALKVNVVADNIYDIWKNSAAAKSAQAVFLDLSIPKNKAPVEDEGVAKEDAVESMEASVYEELRKQLIRKGIPKEQVRFMHEAKTDEQKQLLFHAVNNGKVRVLVGSTERMGAGANIQKRLLALHHVDVPWRPADIEQREGRIVRQGNTSATVKLFQYVTEGSFDAYMWGTVSTKAKMINTAMSGDLSLRTIADTSTQVLSYKEATALASGDTSVQERIEAEMELNKLRQARQIHYEAQRQQEWNARASETKVRRLEGEVALMQDSLHKKLEWLTEHGEDTPLLQIPGIENPKGEDILVAARALGPGDSLVIGKYGPFDITVSRKKALGSDYLSAHIDDLNFDSGIGKDSTGGGLLNSFTVAFKHLSYEAVSSREDSLRVARKANESLKAQTAEPFSKQAELDAAEKRLDELDRELGILEDDPGADAAEAHEEEPEERSGERGAATLDFLTGGLVGQRRPARRGGAGFWATPQREIIGLDEVAQHTNMQQFAGKTSGDLLRAGYVRGRGNGIEISSIDAVDPMVLRLAVKRASQGASELFVDLPGRSLVYDTAELEEKNWALNRVRPAQTLSGQYGASPLITDIAASLNRRFGPEEGPKANYSGLGSFKDRFLRNLSQLEKANLRAHQAAVRAAASRAQSATILRAAVPSITKALEGSNFSWEELRLALIESRLRGIKERWERFADQAETATDDDLKQTFTQQFAGLLDVIEGKRGIPQDVAQTAAALFEAEDWESLSEFLAQTFRDAAANVAEAMAPAWYDAVVADPKAQDALGIYKRLVERPMAENHALNEGIFSDALGPLDTYYPLISLTREQHGTPGRRLPYHKPRNIANQFATGLSEGYDSAMEALKDRLAAAVRANDKAALLTVLEEEGWLTPLGRGEDAGTFVAPDGTEYKGVKIERSPSRLIIQNKKVTPTPASFAVIPAWLEHELRPILDREKTLPRGMADRIVSAINWISLAGPADFVFHTANLLGTVIANTPFLGTSLVDKGLSLPLVKKFAAVAKVLSVDPTTPEAAADVIDMAKLGLIPSRYGSETYSRRLAEELGAEKKPPFVMGPLLYGPHGIDSRARLFMYRLAKQINPRATPNELFHFVNQLGNYTPELQGQVERFLKRVGVSPFFTAGSTMIRNGINAWSGAGPVPKKGIEFRIWQQLTGGGIALVALWAVVYQAYTGKWPWEDKRAKFLQIPANEKDRRSRLGRALWGNGSEVGYLNFAFFNPLVNRGARALGIPGAFETKALGGTWGQAEEAAERDILNSFAHPAMGPVPRAAFVGIGRVEPYLTGFRDMRGRISPQFYPAVPPKTAPGWKTIGNRALFAAKEVNAFYGSLGEATGLVAPENEKGNKALRGLLDLVLPGAVGNASNPTKRANIVRAQRTGTR